MALIPIYWWNKAVHSFRISQQKRLSFLKNGSFYDIDRGADPDYQISTPEKYYDRKTLTDYINSLY